MRPNYSFFLLKVSEVKLKSKLWGFYFKINYISKE